MLLIGRLLRSITRTFSVTSSVLIVSLSPSLISAVVGSGVGVGLGFKTGGGGGSARFGAMRRAGPHWGVGAGWAGVAPGGTPVLAVRAAGLWARLAPEINI